MVHMTKKVVVVSFAKRGSDEAPAVATAPTCPEPRSSEGEPRQARQRCRESDSLGQQPRRLHASTIPYVQGIDTAVREVVREAVREEVRRVLREELAVLRALGPSPPVDEDTYLSVADAARVANVHEGTIRKWIDKGWLPGYRAGRHRRLKRAELDRFMTALGGAKVVDVDERASELAAT